MYVVRGSICLWMTLTTTTTTWSIADKTNDNESAFLLPAFSGSQFELRRTSENAKGVSGQSIYQTVKNLLRFIVMQFDSKWRSSLRTIWSIVPALSYSYSISLPCPTLLRYTSFSKSVCHHSAAQRSAHNFNSKLAILLLITLRRWELNVVTQLWSHPHKRQTRLVRIGCLLTQLKVTQLPHNSLHTFSRSLVTFATRTLIDTLRLPPTVCFFSTFISFAFGRNRFVINSGADCETHVQCSQKLLCCTVSHSHRETQYVSFLQLQNATILMDVSDDFARDKPWLPRHSNRKENIPVSSRCRVHTVNSVFISG